MFIPHIRSKIKAFLTDNNWQPLVVVDVRVFSDQDLSSFLVESLIIPVWVQMSQDGGNSVVFSQ
jgi:hypothetical protein